MNHKEISLQDFFNILIDNNIMMEAKPPSEQKEYIQPDDDYDFHTYRILLLVRMCGMIKEPFLKIIRYMGEGNFHFMIF